MLQCLVNGRIKRFQRWSVNITSWHAFHQALVFHPKHLLSLKTSSKRHPRLPCSIWTLAAMSNQILKDVNDIFIVCPDRDCESLILF